MAAPESLSTNELVLTLVDQAHQNRRLNDQNVGLTATIDQLAAENAELHRQLEAKAVAAEIIGDKSGKETKTP
jgi:hypothetical protein